MNSCLWGRAFPVSVELYNLLTCGAEEAGKRWIDAATTVLEQIVLCTVCLVSSAVISWCKQTLTATVATPILLTAYFSAWKSQ